MARKEQNRGSDKNSKKATPAKAAKAQSPVAVAVASSTMKGGGKVKEKSGTIVGRCICAHEFQDSRYGASMRVFNIGRTTAHCTVCGASRGS